MKRIACWITASWVLLAGVSTCYGADYAGAYLQLGSGARGPGLGGSYSAAVTGPEATYWNPAGLTRVRGVRMSSSILPLSLDRLHNSAATAVNLRGDLAFGFAWIHAGVDHIQGRTGSGVPTGSIDDNENAFLVAVARALGDRVGIGVTLKVLDQDMDVPGWTRSDATGHALDAGIQVRAARDVYLAAVVRNMDASLNWKVERSSIQASSTSDDLQQSESIGAAARPISPLLVTAEISHAADTYVSLGAEWTVNDLLTLRGGVHRASGDDATPRAWGMGLSLRPMRTDDLLFHYAFVTDPIGDGDRSIFALSMSF